METLTSVFTLCKRIYERYIITWVFFTLHIELKKTLHWIEVVYRGRSMWTDPINVRNKMFDNQASWHGRSRFKLLQSGLQSWFCDFLWKTAHFRDSGYSGKSRISHGTNTQCERFPWKMMYSIRRRILTRLSEDINEIQNGGGIR